MKNKINITNKQKVLSLIFVLLIVVASFFVDDIDNVFNSDSEKVTVYYDDFRIHFIDVGTEDAIFITQNDKAMLIDAGTGKKDCDKVLAYINELGYKSLEYVVATHCDSDHIGGIIQLLNSEKIDINNVLYSKDNCNTTTCDNFKKILNKPENKFTNVISFAKEEYNFGNANIKVLSPDVKIISEKSNENSIVLLITYNENKFLFMGDAEENNEKYILDEKLAEDVDLIKVGHHGSNTSSSEKFIKIVKPEYSIIMNNSDEPNKSVIDLLDNYGEIYTTKKNGTITVISNGEEKGKLGILTEKTNNN